MERWQVKVLCTLGLFFIMGVFVLLPIKVSRSVARMGHRGKLIISILSCFGGGVFVGAYLTHMNPEVRAVLEDALLVPKNITYPLPELLAGVGFFFIMFVERFVQMLRSNSTRKNTDFEQAASNANVLVHPTYYVNGTCKKGPSELREAMNRRVSGSQPPSTDVTRESNSSLVDLHWVLHQKDPKNITPDVMVRTTSHGALSLASTTSKILPPSGDDHGAQTRSIIFMVAMSLDCIFEGLALGLMYHAKDVVDIFVAVISHEFIMSFCIGLELVKYHRTIVVVAAGLFYAFTPVIGAIVGICIAEVRSSLVDQNSIDVATGVLQAMSAGTFIYCSFLGILKDNLDNDHGLLKSVVVLLGFSLMAGMAAIPESTASTAHSDIHTLINTTNATTPSLII